MGHIMCICLMKSGASIYALRVAEAVYFTSLTEKSHLEATCLPLQHFLAKVAEEVASWLAGK